MGILQSVKAFISARILESLRVTKRVPKIMSTEESIRFLSSHPDVSLARYGDGEFRWASGIQNNFSFQSDNRELQSELAKVLYHPNNKVCVGIPEMFDHPRRTYIDFSVSSWAYLWVIYYRKWIPLLNKDITYLDANLSRLYIDRRDKTRSAELYQEISKLWENKRILIIEGTSTLMGVGNDLFDNAVEIKRIEIPATNAFDFVDRIESEIRQHISNVDCCILAAGPTATVLVNRIADVGIPAYDLGHIDLEYEWMINGAETRQEVGGRFVNEIDGKSRIKTIQDVAEYEQVIAEIK